MTPTTPDVSTPSVCFPPDVIDAFLRIRQASDRHQYAKVRYLSQRYQKRFPLYAGYFLEKEGLSLKQKGDDESATDLLLRADDFFEGTNSTVLINLMAQIIRTGRLEEAEKRLQRGLEHSPDSLPLQTEVCRVLFEKGELHEAIRQMIPLCEAHREHSLWYLAGLFHFELAHYRESDAAFAQCLDLNPEEYNAWSNLLFLPHYNPYRSLKSLKALHVIWEKYISGKAATPQEKLQRDCIPEKKLRIGILASGLHKHPVGWMSAYALQNLSRLPGYELFFYCVSSKRIEQDTFRCTFRNAAKKWYYVKQWSEDRLYNQVLDDKLDIAIDMCGHTEGSQSKLFARRLAPVQVKWVGGLCDTTGVPAMDYLLSDRFETPDGIDDHYTEKLIRLPNSYVSYTPPLYEGVEPIARPEGSPICFGCFNNIYKLNPVIAGVWSELLRRVPDSTLFFKANTMAQKERREMVIRLFTDNGIDPDRIHIEGDSPHHELLLCYNRIDVALDPWPYTGGLTTLEAIWMGVPVVTTPGPSFAGRHAMSHLSNLGLESLVAESFEEYIEIAVKLATDRKLLTDLRVILPYTLLCSPLTSPVQLAADLDTAFRAMWRRHCEGLPPIAMRFEQESPIPDELLPYATDGYLTEKLKNQEEGSSKNV